MKLNIKNILMIAAILIIVSILILAIEEIFGLDLNIGRRQWGTGFHHIENTVPVPLV